MADSNSLNYYRSTIYSEDNDPPEEKPDDEKGSADKRQKQSEKIIHILFIQLSYYCQRSN